MWEDFQQILSFSNVCEFGTQGKKIIMNLNHRRKIFCWNSALIWYIKLNSMSSDNYIKRGWMIAPKYKSASTFSLTLSMLQKILLMWLYQLDCDCLKAASKVVQSKLCKLRKIYNKLDLPTMLGAAISLEDSHFYLCICVCVLK